MREGDAPEVFIAEGRLIGSLGSGGVKPPPPVIPLSPRFPDLRITSPRTYQPYGGSHDDDTGTDSSHMDKSKHMSFDNRKDIRSDKWILTRDNYIRSCIPNSR